MANPEPGAPNRTRLRQWGGLALAAAFLIVGCGFLLRQRKALLSSIEVHQEFLLTLALAEAVMLLARGLLTRELCRAFDVRLRVSEALSLASWTTLANYVAPLVGGAGLRAVYLKRRHALPYSHFLSLHAGTYAIHFWIGGLFGLVALGFLPMVPETTRRLMTILFVCAFSGCTVVMLAPGWLRRLGIQGGGRVQRVLEGAERLSTQRRSVIFLLLTVNLLAMSASLFSAFRVLGIALAPIEALLLATVTSYSVLLSITPASFGITESVIVFAAGLVGVPAPVALAAAGTKRLLSLAVTAIAAAVAAATGNRIQARPPANEGKGGL